jgi:hypothetical protein
MRILVAEDEAKARRYLGSAPAADTRGDSHAPAVATRTALRALLALSLAGCAAVPTAPAPDLQRQARALDARRLDDPGLAAAEARLQLPSVADAAWTPDRITVAAWYFDPALTQARAGARRAEADAALAAQRSNPTLQLSPEKILSGGGVGSPWTIAAALLIPLLHPGESAARRDIAAADTEQARDQAALALWQSRTRALGALREVLLARQISWPPGTYPVFGGDAAAQSAASRQLLVHAAMALAGVILLLYLALRSMRSVTLVLVNLPFALVGGVAVALAMGGTLSLGGLVGFVTLFGISVRNAIMLVSHYRHLVEAEGLPWNMETAQRGAAERLVPILMTALVTALGLLPLALTAGAPGNELEGAMAAVILGGLLTSTLLNLLVLPVLSVRWLRLSPPAAHAL